MPWINPAVETSGHRDPHILAGNEDPSTLEQVVEDIDLPRDATFEFGVEHGYLTSSPQKSRLAAFTGSRVASEDLRAQAQHENVDGEDNVVADESTLVNAFHLESCFKFTGAAYLQVQEVDMIDLTLDESPVKTSNKPAHKAPKIDVPVRITRIEPLKAPVPTESRNKVVTPKSRNEKLRGRSHEHNFVSKVSQH